MKRIPTSVLLALGASALLFVLGASLWVITAPEPDLAARSACEGFRSSAAVVPAGVVGDPPRWDWTGGTAVLFPAQIISDAAKDSSIKLVSEAAHDLAGSDTQANFVAMHEACNEVGL